MVSDEKSKVQKGSKQESGCFFGNGGAGLVFCVGGSVSGIWRLGWFLVSGAWFLASGAWFLASDVWVGFWYLAPGFWYPTFGFWYLAPGVWYLAHGLVSGIWCWGWLLVFGVWFLVLRNAFCTFLVNISVFRKLELSL